MNEKDCLTSLSLKTHQQTHFFLYYSIFFSFLVVFAFNGFSQEKLAPLTSNHLLHSNKGIYILKSQSNSVSDTLILNKYVRKVGNMIEVDSLFGFYDDFSELFDESNENVFPKNKIKQPNPQLWSSGYDVFLNSSYGINPPSIGVATFDLLDGAGNLYEKSGRFFEADVLTSMPIRFLSKKNIALSFYYQAQGYGEMPEIADSLVLEFRSPKTTKWYKVWSVAGKRNHAFEQVYISLQDTNTLPKGFLPADSLFLQDGFQFRFKNLGSFTEKLDEPGRNGNGDIWNIDYIILRAERTPDDTLYLDVAIKDPIKGLLRTYQSMPWNHFSDKNVQSIEQAKETKVTLRNFENVPMSTISYQSTLKNLYSGNNYIGENGTFGIEYDMLLLLDGSNRFSINDQSKADSALVKYQFKIDVSQYDIFPSNGNMLHYQLFKDFYAYDDGSPEQGYGLGGVGTDGGKVALRYRTFKPDTLFAIDILFNQTLANVTSGYYFNLNVWENLNGSPGSLIEVLTDQTPKFVDLRDGFYRYYLNNPVFVSDEFFIGWQQPTSYYLNVGYDMNQINNDKLYYNIANYWVQSSFPGSLMMRPVFSKKNATKFSAFKEAAIEVYPNPASDYLRCRSFEKNDFIGWTADLIDIAGNIIRQYSQIDQDMYVGDLTPGMYFVRINRKHTNSITVKINIIR